MYHNWVTDSSHVKNAKHFKSLKIVITERKLPRFLAHGVYVTTYCICQYKMLLSM